MPPCSQRTAGQYTYAAALLNCMKSVASFIFYYDSRESSETFFKSRNWSIKEQNKARVKRSNWLLWECIKRSLWILNNPFNSRFNLHVCKAVPRSVRLIWGSLSSHQTNRSFLKVQWIHDELSVVSGSRGASLWTRACLLITLKNIVSFFTLLWKLDFFTKVLLLVSFETCSWQLRLSRNNHLYFIQPCFIFTTKLLFFW